MKQYFFWPAALILNLLCVAFLNAQPCDTLAPVCKAGLPAASHPVDADGDGIIDSGGYTITVQELLESPPADCPGPFSYTMRWADNPQAAVADSLFLPCADYSPGSPRQLELVAANAEGQTGTCQTTVLFFDQDNFCGYEAPWLSGYIRDRHGAPLPGVTVVAHSHSGQDSTLTDESGYYEITGLFGESTVTLELRPSGNPPEGISTLDELVLRKHMLGLEVLSDSLLLLAADLDGSGHISLLDLIIMRKLLLGLQTDLQPSWRFVPIPSDADEIDSLLVPNEFHGSDFHFTGNAIDFTGVKVGDLDGP